MLMSITNITSVTLGIFENKKKTHIHDKNKIDWNEKLDDIMYSVTG